MACAYRARRSHDPVPSMRDPPVCHPDRRASDDGHTCKGVKGFSLGTSSEFSLRPSKVIRRSTDKRERVCAKVDSMNRPGISAIRYSGMPGRRRRRSRRHRHRHCRRNQKRDGRPNGEVNAKTILAPCQAISFAREAVVAISASNSEQSTLAIDKAINGHSRRFCTARVPSRL